MVARRVAAYLQGAGLALIGAALWATMGAWSVVVAIGFLSTLVGVALEGRARSKVRG